MEDAIKNGQPQTLTIDRLGASTRRTDALSNVGRVPGKHLDEYPPAMFAEGGVGASIKAIDPASNMSAYIGNCCRFLADGSKVKIDVVD